MMHIPKLHILTRNTVRNLALGTVVIGSLFSPCMSYAETAKQCDRAYWQANSLLIDIPPRLKAAITFDVFVTELKRSRLCEALQELAFVATEACDFTVPELAERNEKLLVKVEPKLMELQISLAICKGAKLIPLAP